jgi:hypothetical protein
MGFKENSDPCVDHGRYSRSCIPRIDHKIVLIRVLRCALSELSMLLQKQTYMWVTKRLLVHGLTRGMVSTEFVDRSALFLRLRGNSDLFFGSFPAHFFCSSCPSTFSLFCATSLRPVSTQTFFHHDSTWSNDIDTNSHHLDGCAIRSGVHDVVASHETGIWTTKDKTCFRNANPEIWLGLGKECSFESFYISISRCANGKSILECTGTCQDVSVTIIKCTYPKRSSSKQEQAHAHSPASTVRRCVAYHGGPNDSSIVHCPTGP